MAALSHNLAAAVASRLATIIPSPFSVIAEGEEVKLYSERSGSRLLGVSPAAAILEDSDDRSLLEKMEVAALAIVSAIQDCVAEEMREPWPVQRDGAMALPQARSEGMSVIIWFGSEEAPDIALAPIKLSEAVNAD